MKVNTGSAMKPNSFRLIPEPRSASPDFHKLNGAGQHNGRQPPLEREDQLASKEIVRAQDQRSSSIEV
jgi:hypothetical protein